MSNKMRHYINSAIRKTGKSTSDIIKASGVGRTSFYEIMRGVQTPRIDTACKISKALGASVMDVFPELKEMSKVV